MKRMVKIFKTNFLQIYKHVILSKESGCREVKIGNHCFSLRDKEAVIHILSLRSCDVRGHWVKVIVESADTMMNKLRRS